MKVTRRDKLSRGSIVWPKTFTRVKVKLIRWKLADKGIFLIRREASTLNRIIKISLPRLYSIILPPPSLGTTRQILFSKGFRGIPILNNKRVTCIHSALYVSKIQEGFPPWRRRRERERELHTFIHVSHWQRCNWYKIISFANKWNILFSLFINLKNICSMIYRLRIFVPLPCHETRCSSMLFLARSKSRYLKNWHSWQRSNKHKVPVISS